MDATKLQRSGLNFPEVRSDLLPPRSAFQHQVHSVHDVTDAPSIDGYEILGRLGAGGMGVVWRARQLSTRREVALKFMSMSTVGSEAARRRFEREVEMASMLEHPCIARVYDSGIQRGQFYYAMELVKGLPLDAFVKRQSLGPRQILSLMSTVCQAVQHAHQRGVIHRDLKPSNILVDGQGTPHVLDFGLGKLVDPTSAKDSITLSREWAGTPAFMSPEQASGKAEAMDTRTDVYSLGVIVYLLTTGRYPHDTEGDHLTILNRIADDEIIRPRKALRGIDGELEAVLMKALGRLPADRYPSAGSLAVDLDNYLKGEPLTARQPTAFYFLRKKARKYRLRLGLVGLGLIGLLGAGVYGSAQVARQRDLAISAATEESSQRQMAELRLAGSLSAWGDSLGGQNHWQSAESRYWDAKQILDREGRFPMGADIGLLDAFSKSPAALSICPGSEIKGRPTLSHVFLHQDGRTVRRAARDGTIRSFDILTGRETGVIGTAMSNANVLDSTFVASGQFVVRYLSTEKFEKTPHFWIDLVNAGTDQVVDELQLGGRSQIWPAFSPDGRYAAVSQGEVTPDAHRSLVLLDISGQSVPKTLMQNADGIATVTFTSDSRQLATYYESGRIEFWDVASGLMLHGYSVPQPAKPDAISALPSMVLAPDNGSVLYSFSSRTVGVASLGQSACAQLEGYSHPARGLAFSPDGNEVVSADDDGNLRLSDSRTGRTVRSFVAGKRVMAASYSTDGKFILTQNREGSIQAWPATVNEGPVFRNHSAEPQCLALSRDGRLAAAWEGDNTLNIFDRETGSVIRSVHVLGGVTSIGFSTDSKWLVTASDAGEVYRFGVYDSAELKTCAAGCAVATISGVNSALAPTYCYTTVLAPDTRTALTLTAKGAILVDAIHGIPLRSFDRESDTAGCFSADGNTILLLHASSVQGLKVCDVNLGSVEDIPFRQSHAVTSIAISNDRKFAYLGSDDGSLGAVDLRSGKADWQSGEHQRAVKCLRLTADEKMLLSGSDDGTLRLWDATDGRELHTLVSGLSSVSAVTMSPDSTVIWCNSGKGSSYLWDLSLPEKIRDAEASAATGRAALAKNPADGAAIMSLAEWYFLVGEPEWAKQVLDGPGVTRVATLTSARVRWKAGDFQGAVKDFDAILSHETDEGQREYLLACRNAAAEGSR